MKITVKIFVLLLATLLATTTALATQTGYAGKLWDSDTPPSPWQYGATIYATNCLADGTLLGTAFYGETQVSAGTSTFDVDWKDGGAPDAPNDGDYVCLYVVFNAGSSGTPTPVLTDPQPVLFFVSGHINFGNIQSGTGPNAVELVDFSVAPQSSGNTWLPYILLVGSVALVSGAVAVIRKRKA